MRSLWRFCSTLMLIAVLLPALAAAAATVQVGSPTQPQGGHALSGATVAMVAVILTNTGSDPATITGLTVQKVGSASDASVASLQANDSATDVLATVPAAFDAAHSILVPLSASIDAGQSKTVLISAVMAQNLTPYLGQSFEFNITGVNTAAGLTGPLPIYGAQASISSAVPPPTCSLGSSQGSYQVGDTVNIVWNSANATGGTITGIGSVAPQGLQGILPGGSSQTLVGTFNGPGGTGTCQLTLTLNAQGTGGTVFGSGGVAAPGTVGAPGANGTGGAVVGSGGTVGTPTGSTASGGTGSGGIGDVCTGLNCRPCDLAQLAQNVINAGVGLSIPIAAAMFAWAGILYFTSASNPKNIGKARSVFKTVFWGFLIAISAWLIVQILINAIVNKNFFTNGSWNSLQCSAQNTRPGTPGGGYSNIGTLLNSATGNLVPTLTNPNGVPLAVGQTSVFDGTFSNFTQTCNTSGGYQLTTNEAGQQTCYNSSTQDFQNPSYTSTPNSAIAAAALAYQGTNTSSGPGDGRVACVWSVNNILQNAGVAAIDGNSVALMQQDLQGGRGIPVATADAQPGDIIVWKNDSVNVSHVGICETTGCTTAVSNSSSAASFVNSSGSTLLGVPGVVYRVTK